MIRECTTIFQVTYAFDPPATLPGRMMLSRLKNHRCCGHVESLQCPPHSSCFQVLRYKTHRIAPLRYQWVGRKA
jgi:hypothetical protein